MTDSSAAPQEETTPPRQAQDSGDGFRADLPLAILESVRRHDRPAEVLEDEDLAASLPRRLGLTGVVESQIQRYRVAQRRRELISHEQVGDLLKLVLRRPDSEPILREAGREMARQHARKPLYRLAAIGRFLPATIARRIARRSVRRLVRRIAGGTPFHVERDDLQVSANGAVTARVDRWGVACVLYGAAIEEAVRHATGTTPHVEHTECEAGGGGKCVWTVRSG